MHVIKIQYKLAFFFFPSKEITSGCICARITQWVRNFKLNSGRKNPDIPKSLVPLEEVGMAKEDKASMHVEAEGSDSPGKGQGRFRNRHRAPAVPEAQAQGNESRSLQRLSEPCWHLSARAGARQGYKHQSWPTVSTAAQTAAEHTQCANIGSRMEASWGGGGRKKRQQGQGCSGSRAVFSTITPVQPPGIVKV